MEYQSRTTPPPSRTLRFEPSTLATFAGCFTPRPICFDPRDGVVRHITHGESVFLQERLDVRPALVPDANVRVCSDEKPGAVDVSRDDREVERSPSVFRVAHVRARARVEEQAHRLDVSVARGEVQRGPVALVHRVDVGTAGDERGDHLGRAAVVRRLVQGSAHVGVHLRDVLASLERLAHHLAVVVAHSIHQRARPRLRVEHLAAGEEAHAARSASPRRAAAASGATAFERTRPGRAPR